MNATLKSIASRTPLVREAALWMRSFNRSMAAAGPGVYTLCYHRTEPRYREALREQLSFFAEHGAFVSATAAAELLASGVPITQRHFVLSFDDGYADNVTTALPVLRENSVPAIMFVVSDWVQDGRSARDRTYVTKSDLAKWLSSGLEVGSHTASHRRLSGLTLQEAREEFARSSDWLSNFSNSAVRHFACPWGVASKDFDAGRDPVLAADHGYRTFFTTRRGVATSADDLMLMPRHVVEPSWGLYQLDALIGERSIDHRD